MGAYFKRWLWVVLVVTGLSQAAAAEELVMPFTCAAQSGAVQLTPSAETSYKIAGTRQERIFTACLSGAATCENMMVHRFAIDCGGTKASWASVVEAANNLGIKTPNGLPLGFAPATTLKARFVLPALANFNPFRSKVEVEQLPADGVVAFDEGDQATRVAAWRTEVRADTVPQGKSRAFRVGAIISFLMIILAGISLIAAGRWRVPQFATVLQGSAPEVLWRLAHRARASFGQSQDWLGQNIGRVPDWIRGDAESAGNSELLNAASVAMARLIEAELHVATLPAGLLLREVLLSELDRVRERLNGVTRDLDRRPKDKSAGMIRAVLRELDRIGRIAQGADRDSRHDAGDSEGPAPSMPQSVAEAYRILGINADAEPAVTKKLVDALRMSWHPDYARDGEDRRKREERMKQINAAWDLIKDVRKAA